MTPEQRALSSGLRKQLETSVLSARRAAESAARAAVEGLDLFAEQRPDHLTDAQTSLREGLRAKWRQLGSDAELLVAECAYEQWHRLLFARFLAENNLLLHPEYKAPVTLSDCEELSAELAEPDAWSVAARFAAEILPGIFRLDDPCVQLRLAPEGRHALEEILDGIPRETFAARDALGWVYQFWQKDKKQEVTTSERRIGGADLGPSTQLFTENYMVRFLLENSLGAWWATQHPNSPLIDGMDYLRLNDDAKPAAGGFQGWPERVAEVTVMDPCCGSGHFLVEAFSMLWQMRAEEEGLDCVEAQDAVLQDNLFGLELDSRCVQIAMFAIAIQAWKAGGGWRQLPVPNIACSGIPVSASVEEWKVLARGDYRLENALTRLHVLFGESDTLGSLIDPRHATEFADPNGVQPSFDDIDWDDLAPVLQSATDSEVDDPAAAVLKADVAGLWRSASLLARGYTLVATNVPFLSRGKQVESLQEFCDKFLREGRSDLATSMLLRWSRVATVAVVTPQNWQEKSTYKRLREWILENRSYCLFARIGNNVWQTQSGGQPFKVPTALSVLDKSLPIIDTTTSVIDIGNGPLATKAGDLQKAPLVISMQSAQRDNPESRILAAPVAQSAVLLGAVARCLQGTSTGDTPRYVRYFWEIPKLAAPWRRFQSSTTDTSPYIGRESIVRWDGPGGVIDSPGSAIRGDEAWGKPGVSVTQMGNLNRALYLGDLFDTNAAAVVPHDPALVPALWAFCTSDSFVPAVRSVASSTQVTNGALEVVPFDVDHWRSVAARTDPLPEPSSDDPRQWLFTGRPEVSLAPLQVAIARLVGYQWPDHMEPDNLTEYADPDGIICLPAVAGKVPGADRVQQLLARAFGDAWTPVKVRELLDNAGYRKQNLSDWLRDEFFKQHCALFRNRPFIWHIWDGQREGFSALLNYHRLDHKMLEKVTYTYLGQDWVERQRAELRDEVPGAGERLSAALSLQKRLESILEGESPHDVYVRWKEPHEQPIGWEPDLNDGVRLNIRPFAQSGVLRAPINVHWRKDRGRNVDGSKRENDEHPTLAEKMVWRDRARQE
ncbi:hypothetical protein PV768_01535 [Pseudarthrobacter sp. CC4]|uniref:DNA methyltransferase n=1 Tax=Pseudarthrobacter sp. CC4 TaxID=3029190 RepID=UPI003B8E7F68